MGIVQVILYTIQRFDFQGFLLTYSDEAEQDTSAKAGLKIQSQATEKNGLFYMITVK